MAIFTAEQIIRSQAWQPHAQFWNVDQQKVRNLTAALNALNAGMWSNGAADIHAAGALANATAELLESLQ
ncbi:MULTISPECIES: hypothetical protein [Mycolicibacter]|uniref:Uncharacterized protein n=2 Tax=Mycolicibacter TaxID=1073531 RepID=A0ABU5XL94_9MYCO|nr:MULTISPECIES: hypothetical protein [unclassified Mycolicibacter]MEB3023032.1 hypothetical protein [Mycolicibacter sp. MYC098]MEB3033542.1 hypothetical protein [Mycolicibacter sp. MYC340]